MFGRYRRNKVTAASAAEVAACRRDQTDRRQQHARAMMYSLFMRRRQGPRRILDVGKPHYVDIHEPAILALSLVIVLLCVADAFFTLTILQRGGEELNPFMRLLLEKDVVLFFAVKFLLTSFGLVFTVIHKHFRIFKMISGYHVLYGVFVMYAVLIYYEVLLLI